MNISGMLPERVGMGYQARVVLMATPIVLSPFRSDRGAGHQLLESEFDLETEVRIWLDHSRAGSPTAWSGPNTWSGLYAARR